MPKPSAPIAARSGAPWARLVAILVMLSVPTVPAAAAAVSRSPSYDGFRACIGERFRVYGGRGAREKRVARPRSVGPLPVTAAPHPWDPRSGPAICGHGS